MQSGYCNLSEFVVKFLQYGKEVFMEKLVLIDGNSLINRAFYATKLLTTREGVPTNGVFGFTNAFKDHIGHQACVYGGRFRSEGADFSA